MYMVIEEVVWGLLLTIFVLALNHWPQHWFIYL